MEKVKNRDMNSPQMTERAVTSGTLGLGGDVGLVGLAGRELLVGFRREGFQGRLHRGLLSQRVVYERNSGCETQDVFVYLDRTSSLRR